MCIQSKVQEYLKERNSISVKWGITRMSRHARIDEEIVGNSHTHYYSELKRRK